MLTSSVGFRLLRDELDVAQELAQTLEGVVLALDRHQHLAGRGQAVDRQQAERGRAVDEHEVVVVEDRLEGPAEAQLPAEGRHQLDLGAGQVEAGGRDEQVAHGGRLDAVLEGDVVQHDVVHRRLEVAGVDAQAGAGVALGIEVDDQRPVAEVGQAGAEVHGGRGLAHAALLVGDRQDPRERTHRCSGVRRLDLARRFDLARRVGSDAHVGDAFLAPATRPWGTSSTAASGGRGIEPARLGADRSLPTSASAQRSMVSMFHVERLETFHVKHRMAT